MRSTQLGIVRDPENMGIELLLRRLNKGQLLVLEVQLSIMKEIKSNQKDDAKLERLK